MTQSKSLSFRALSVLPLSLLALVFVFNFAAVNVAHAAVSLCGGGPGSSPILTEVNQHIVNNPDSSNSGKGDWANDTYVRNIKVWETSTPGTYCGVTTDTGTFTTNGTFSPQSGDALPSNITGTMTGGETWEIVGATSSAPTLSDNSWVPGQKYSEWTTQYFDATSTPTLLSWAWDYTSPLGEVWHNAVDVSTGDIHAVYDSTSKVGYATIQDAVTAAADGDTIVLGSDFTTSAQITISKAITLDGNGYTIHASFPKVDNTNNSAIGIGHNDVTIKNLTLDGTGGQTYPFQLHGVNAFLSSGVNLDSVTIKNFGGSGVVVNGSDVTATNLNTSGDGWNSVNVDPGAGVTVPSVFTLNSGNLGDNYQIWSDGKYVTSSATVVVNLPTDYLKYKVVDPKNPGTLWENKPISNVAVITDNGTSTAYTTIQAAINAANPGDTINVGPGTYSENQITITKPATIQGSGVDVSIVDGGNALLTDSGLVKITATGDVKFDGFTLKNAGGPLKGAFKVRVGIATDATSGSPTYTISNNKILGTNDANEEQDYGFYAMPGGLENIVFSNNQITQTGANAILVEKHPGATLISNNTLDVGAFGSDAIFYMTYGGVDITTPQKIDKNIIDVGTGSGKDNATGISFMSSYSGSGPLGEGKYSNIEVTNNTINNLGASRRGISLYNDGLTDGSAGEISGATISGNTITGTSIIPSNFGIRLAGLVDGSIVTNNTIKNAATGIQITTGRNSGSATPTDTLVHMNGLEANGVSVDNSATSTALDATNNWWGTASSTLIAGMVTGNVNFTPFCVNDTCITADTSALDAARSAAQALITINASESSTPNQHVIGSLAILKTALAAATATSADPQSVVDSQATTLNAAIATYNAAIVPTPAPVSNGGGGGGGSSASSNGNGGGSIYVPAPRLQTVYADGHVVYLDTPASTVAPLIVPPPLQRPGRVLGAAAFNFTRGLSIGERGDDVTELQNRLTAEGVYSGPITGYFGSLTSQAVKLFQAKYGISQVGLVGPQTRQKLNEIELEAENALIGGDATSTEATSTEATSTPDSTATSTEDATGAGCSNGNKYNANTGALCPVNASGTGSAFGAAVSAFTRSLGIGSRGEDVRQLQLRLINAGFLNATSTGYFGPLTEDALKRFQEQHQIETTGTMGPKTRAELDK